MHSSVTAKEKTAPAQPPVVAAASTTTIPKQATGSAASMQLTLPSPWGLNLAPRNALRKGVNIVKATMAVMLAFGFVLYDQTNTMIQARTWANVILAVLVQTPSQTVGSFLDSAIISSLGLALAGACWAFMNTVAGTSYAIMGVLLFLFVYFFSLFRAMSQRFFGFGLIGPLLSYTAVASVVGVLGPSTANGDPFDRAFLRDTLYSFLIGFAISATLAFFIWPEFAERDLRVKIITITDITRRLVSENVEVFTTGTSSCNRRSLLLIKLKEELRAASKILAKVDTEVYYSKYSSKDYHKVLASLNAVCGHLSSLDGAFAGREESVFQTDLFKTRVTQPFFEELAMVDKECSNVLYTFTSALVDLSKVTLLDSEKALPTSYKPAEIASVQSDLRVALGKVDASLHEWLIELVVRGDSSDPLIMSEDNLAKGSVAKEALVQVSFFIHAFKEIMEKLADIALITSEPNRRHGFHYNAFSGLFKKSAPSSKPKTVKKLSSRRVLIQLTRFLLSRESIFAIKCSVAVLIYQIILFNQTFWYRSYFLQTSFLTFVVAIAPSVGQTNLSFFINLIGAVLGYTWGFLTLEAFGTGPNKVNQSIVGAYGNRNNPLYDGPWNRYYKLLASASMAISFAYIFTVLVYPNLARQNLRQRISSVLRRLNALYNDTIVAAFSPFVNDTDTAESRVARLEASQRVLADLFDNVAELMVFASVEIRVEGRFQKGAYVGIVGIMRGLLDRLTTASSCLIWEKGEKAWGGGGGARSSPFDPAIKKIVSRELNAARRDVQNTIRLLLYVYSSSMMAKQPLPHSLPSATRARNRVFHEIWAIMEDLANVHDPTIMDDSQTLHKDIDDEKSSYDAFKGENVIAKRISRDSLSGKPRITIERAKEIMQSDSWLRFYSFATTMSMVAMDVDSLSPHMKHLFGELPGFMDIDFLIEEGEPLIPSPVIGASPRRLERSDTMMTGGRRGYEDDVRVYGLEDQDDLEMEEGIPFEVEGGVGGAELIGVVVGGEGEEKIGV
ncbi:hypothetical protein HDU67_001621 [Dinochytrium kinnereticum]|nr:hypothetical protein HDU67_001621 [Dinochytrium kinnereticum]